MAYVQRSVLISIYLSLNVAFGAALQSEVLVWKPWSQVSKDFGPVVLKSSYTLQPGQISVNSWNMSVPEINLRLESTAIAQNIDPDSIQMQIDNLKLEIQIPSVSINQTIEKVVNGSLIRVQINSQCANISLGNHALQISARLNWVWQERFPNPVLESLALNWSDDSWDIPNFSCSGPLGIDAVLLNQIKTSLKDRNLIRSLVYEKIKTEIQSRWLSFKNHLVAGIGLPIPNNSQSNVRFSRIGAWNDKGLAVVGIMETFVEIDPLSIPEMPLKLSNFSVDDFGTQKAVLPKNLLTLIAQAKIEETKLEKINLRQNSGFNTLMRSRFLQFFFWPDLMKFQKSARFEIDFSRFFKLNVQWPNKNIAHISGGLNAQVKGERDSGMLPYLDIATGFSIQANVQKIGQVISISATQPNINLNYRFNEDYVNRFKPSQHISSTIIKKGKSAVTEVVKIETSIDLGSLLGSGVKVNEFEFNQDNIVVDWN